MLRLWLCLVLLACSAHAQSPVDPTGCSLNGLAFGSNPGCNGIPRHWRWPLPNNACYRASVLGILGPAELKPAVLPFSYVTGHTDPTTGREFALLSAWNGLVIVDADRISEQGPTSYRPWHYVRVDPLQTVHRGSASFGEYIYESNLFRPTLRVTALHMNGGGTPVVAPKSDVPLPDGASYRLTVDRRRGHLYVPTWQGLCIFDVNGTNGASPRLLAIWRGWNAPTSIMPSFDVHIQYDGPTVRAVVSEYLTQGTTHISILDVTNLPSGSPAVDPWLPANWVAFPVSVLGGSAAHSAWMSEDGSYLYSSVGDIATFVLDMRGFAYYGANTVLGIGQLPLPMSVAGSSPPVQLNYPNSLPQQQMGMLGLGYTGYASSWQEGLRVYDIRPDNPNPNTPLAYVDTSHSSSSQPYGGPSWSFLYPGAFAVWRLQDSGVLYVSDTDNGLFFVRLNVGHMHRWGKGTAELYNGRQRTPRIVTRDAPPRAHVPSAPDVDQQVTITDLVPGRALVVLVATEGTTQSTPFPLATSACNSYMAGFVGAPIFATANGNGEAVIQLPPVLPAQFRLFLQAFSLVPGTFQCVASSRPTWFGLADPM